MTEKKAPEYDLHRKLAVDLFNHCWDLIEKKDRTPEETDEMIHTAHASRYHWGVVGEAIHRQRGEWQISRVYAVAKLPHPCHYHARRCLEITLENAIGNFDLAFAYEAMARAYSLLNDPVSCQHFIKLANQAGEAIKETDDRKYFFSELNNIIP